MQIFISGRTDANEFERVANDVLSIEEMILDGEAPGALLHYPPDPWEVDELLEIPVAGFQVNVMLWSPWTVSRPTDLLLQGVLGQFEFGGQHYTIWFIDRLVPGWEVER